MDKIKLCELFGPTVEGEGRHIGMPFIFIRTSGCNLNCDYCDTKFSNRNNVDEREYTVGEIIDYIRQRSCRNVSITGGEPFYRSQRELDIFYELCKRIKDETQCCDGVLKVETNATLLEERFLGVIDFWSMSPKLEGMGEGLWYSKDVISKIIDKSKDCQIKFVIGCRKENETMERDLQVVKDLITELKIIDELIVLQPEGSTDNMIEYLDRGRLLVERIVNSNNKDWNFWKDINLQILPQWHKLLWGNSRKK